MIYKEGSDMPYKAILHFPESTEKKEKIFKKIANCRYACLKRYFAGLNLNESQAVEMKKILKNISDQSEKS